MFRLFVNFLTMFRRIAPNILDIVGSRCLSFSISISFYFILFFFFLKSRNSPAVVFFFLISTNNLHGFVDVPWLSVVARRCSRKRRENFLVVWENWRSRKLAQKFAIERYMATRSTSTTTKQFLSRSRSLDFWHSELNSLFQKFLTPLVLSPSFANVHPDTAN